MNLDLFPKGEREYRTPGDVAAGEPMTETPRLRVPHRDQVEIRWASLDQLLEPDHPARMIWAAVCRLDLRRWLGRIRAVEGGAGRDATDPHLLVALWVYATLDGVGSAREVSRLTEKHLAYQWLCGGVTVNYHLLADFRSQGADRWDDLLTQIVGALLAANLIYRLRCQTAEWVNAMCRNRGLWQMPVRGRPKCRTVAVLHAIVHDMVTGAKLCAEAAMASG